MATHTPGPWTIIRGVNYTEDPDDQKILSIEDANGGIVLYTDSGYYQPTEANARLIAAAPELLEAAKRVAAWIDTGCDVSDHAVNELHKAIAKAEGNTP